MIRVVLYLILVGLIAFGVAWIADRPGDVAVTWQGLRIETSVMVVLIGLIALITLAIMLWSLLRMLLRSPTLMSRFLRSRRGSRGYHAISSGLIAIGSGDARAARKFAAEARRLAPSEPLTLLLAAQAAQLAGDQGGAERTFRAMAGRDDTKLLGLHGLFIEARRRQDPVAAQLYAEEAARLSPALGWAGHAVLELRCAAGDWAGALDALDRQAKSGGLDKAALKRQRAVLLTAQAIEAEETDRDRAKVLAMEAVKLAPTLVPAAAMAGRFLGEAGELRKGSRILETAWKAHPHPDLADTYAHLRLGDSARDRLARVQTLARRTLTDPEGALAIARAALDAQDYAVARSALAPLLPAPTRRVALLMAEIERAQHGDEGRTREWIARAVNALRDPVWTADGVVSAQWRPVSPVSGQLDAFQWKVPLTALGEGAVVEMPEPFIAPPEVAAEPPPVVAEALAPEPVMDAPAEPAPPVITVEPPSPAPQPARTEVVTAEASGIDVAAPSPTDAEPAQPPEPVGIRPRPPAPAPVANVIPLIRAPDDPGPDAEPDVRDERQPEPNDSWKRIRTLFE